jgi:8-oxo-dGTP diphosphatase
MLTVSCLILLDSQNSFLAAQRPLQKSLGGLWEFPGGKVEVGESPEEALRRELREELHLEVDSLHPLAPVTHRYDFGYIRLIPFLARCVARPALELVEHPAVRWVNTSDAHSLQWAPADLPILGELFSLLQQKELENTVSPYPL